MLQFCQNFVDDEVVKSFKRRKGNLYLCKDLVDHPIARLLSNHFGRLSFLPNYKYTYWFSKRII